MDSPKSSSEGIAESGSESSFHLDENSFLLKETLDPQKNALEEENAVQEEPLNHSMLVKKEISSMPSISLLYIHHIQGDLFKMLFFLHLTFGFQPLQAEAHFDLKESLVPLSWTSI